MSERARSRSWSVRAALALAALACIASTCNGSPIRLLRPSQNLLVDESLLTVEATVSTNIDPASVRVLLDDVDLVAALGLVPPFFDEAGAVAVGPDLVAITGFTFDTTVGSGPSPLALDLAGFGEGAHTISVDGTRSGNGTTAQSTRFFDRVGSFTQLLSISAVAVQTSLPYFGPSLAFATVGDPVAAPPVSGAPGELRTGLTAAAASLSTTGAP